MADVKEEEFGLYCIFDTVGQKVAPPFCANNENVAVREFLIGCFNANLPPQDMQLLRIGTYTAIYSEEFVFDQETGKNEFHRDLVGVHIHGLDDFEVIDVTEDDVEHYFLALQRLNEELKNGKVLQ
ncbi:MAG: hypothetical protein NC041_04195 [Bacteroides sp.]|nr:hypothetical protein [Prevotella sp.]MCM1407906.1 hypothetical protein [Treponema brennaborense]MCM1469648.1 hypothetical protein [Bacteroides sp.]